MTFDLDPNFG